MPPPTLRDYVCQGDNLRLSPSVEPVPVSPPDGASIPSAGDFIVLRDWGVGVREVERVTPKLLKLKRGGYPGQIPIDDKRVLAWTPDYAVAVKLKDSIAGVDGEYQRRRKAANDEFNARVRAAEEARRTAIDRLVRAASAMSARSAETEGLSPQDASAVGAAETPQHPILTPHPLCARMRRGDWYADEGTD